MPTKAQKDEDTTKPDDGAAADAAVAEVEGETTPDKDTLSVTWRDTEFKIPRRVFNTPQVAMAISSGNVADQMFRILNLADPAYVRLFLAQCVEGDEMVPVALEFFNLLSDAAGSGNS